MDKKTVKARIENLRREIEKYRYTYHVLDKSIVSDEINDSLKKELFDLEQQFPEFVTPDSPTQRVGGEPLNKFKKVRHEEKMLSFNDAFSPDDMHAWVERLENYLNKRINSDFYAELKIDGFAIELVYENGVFVQGSTRGDGVTGEDVTENLKTVEAIPLRISDKHKKLVVRGEVFMNKNEFERINRDQRKANKPEYANPRNTAAGTIRQLDPKIAASRKLDAFMYSLVTDMGQKTHDEEHKLLHELGFKTNNRFNVVFKTLEGVLKYRDEWEKKKEKLPYQIDGVVVVLNDNRTFADAGVVGKAPRGAIAYKFEPEEATTIVEDIKVQVGRTGALTPVAVMRPVHIGGTTVTHATLHNFDQIERLDVRIGDTVIVERAGDVIPQVTGVLKNLRTGKEKKFKIPNKCPIDSSKISHEGAIYRCSNIDCGARLRESLYHFVARGAFNIDGLGPKILDKFIDEGFIMDAADIFTLKREEISQLEGFGNKSADNILSEIESKKKISLPRLMYSLGIFHIGEETALLLAGELAKEGLNVARPTELGDALEKLSLEDLQEIDGIGPKVADSVFNWFKNSSHNGFLKKLDNVVIRIEKFSAKSRGKLLGQSFVVTGTLVSMSRDEAKTRIKNLGGHVSESVSSKTSYVVVGENPGSKAEKAVKLGVKIINEKEFLELLK